MLRTTAFDYSIDDIMLIRLAEKGSQYTEGLGKYSHSEVLVVKPTKIQGSDLSVSFLRWCQDNPSKAMRLHLILLSLTSKYGIW